MGLLLIVVLFAIGVLFALYFSLSPDTGTSQEPKESILARNTVATLRKTTTDCHDRTVEELLQDCARTQGAITCSPGVNTCQKADKVIGDILKEFFDGIGRDYSLTIRNIPYFSSTVYGVKKCKGSQEADEQFIPVGIGYDVPVKLVICRN